MDPDDDLDALINMENELREAAQAEDIDPDLLAEAEAHTAALVPAPDAGTPRALLRMRIGDEGAHGGFVVTRQGRGRGQRPCSGVASTLKTAQPGSARWTPPPPQPGGQGRHAGASMPTAAACWRNQVRGGHAAVSTIPAISRRCGCGWGGGTGALSDPVPSWVVEGAAMRAKQAVGPVVAAMTAQEERAAADRAKVLAAPPEDGNYMYARGDHDATVYLRLKEPVVRSVRCPGFDSTRRDGCFGVA